MIEAAISIKYEKDGEPIIEITTGDIPKSIIMEDLSAITKLFARGMIEECDEMFTESEREKYITARLKVDRQNLKKLIENGKAG